MSALMMNDGKTAQMMLLMIQPAELLIISLFLISVISVPVLTIYGWARWVRNTESKTLFSTLSLVGFSLATASALLAISSGLYALAIGGFRYYDPLLLRIYRVGALLSIIAVGFAIAGVWRGNPLRWYAVVCSAGTLVFWAVSAAGE
jgi:hypothetical protein